MQTVEKAVAGKQKYIRKVSTKGQTVLPVELRKSLGVRDGVDEVEFINCGDGEWRVRKRSGSNPFKKFIGAFNQRDFLNGMNTDEFMAEVRGLPVPEDGEE